MSDKNISINITTGTFIKAMLVAILVVFLYYIRDMVAVVLFSVVVASAVEPAAQWFQRRGLPRIFSVILIYVITFLILAGAFYMVVPPIFNELSDIAVNMPNYLEQPFEANIIEQYLPELPSSISSLLISFAENVKDFIGKLASGFFHATSTIFGGAMSAGLIIVLSFYLSVQESGIENFLKIITPIQHEKYVIDLWLRSRKKIGAWMKGQILLGLLVGVLVFLGLTILRVKYALTFAVIAAIFELIPIFGPILSSIPPIGIAFLQSPALALIVLGLFIVIQQFENHLIYPLVVRKMTGVPPILTILALIIGAKIGGLFGILLSVPLVTVLVEFTNDIEKGKATIDA